MRTRAAIALAAAIMTTPVFAADTVLLHAAGSLRGALTEVGKAFEASGGGTVQAKYGPSGLLKDEIAGGAEGGGVRLRQHGASAGARFRQEEWTGGAVCAEPVVCAGAAGARGQLAGLLDRMLDPAVKLGTSTPKADPSGDYAFEVFARADKIKLGAKSALERKALQLQRGTGERRAAARPQRV